MMKTQKRQKHRIVVAALIFIGLVIVAFFGLRTARAFRELREHRPPPPFATEHVETDVELIRDWMTIPFVSKMYQVRPRVLFEALAIPERGNKEKSLKQLNEEYYPQEEGIVLEKVKAAVRQALANQPDPDTPAVP
jgi:hypothetical protein